MVETASGASSIQHDSATVSQAESTFLDALDDVVGNVLRPLGDSWDEITASWDGGAAGAGQKARAVLEDKITKAHALAADLIDRLGVSKNEFDQMEFDNEELMTNLFDA
ncbi:hypothetical protein OIE68_20930 [Nocardia vinacea]|uniref:hypothetical protein n=1 Tax=Nocardia vinacea TaxID=96468 RepID=UPI002E0E2BA3|nr:hypothetical protein OIE68_20930 [Nocardia vinacea]